MRKQKSGPSPARQEFNISDFLNFMSILSALQRGSEKSSPDTIYEPPRRRLRIPWLVVILLLAAMPATFVTVKANVGHGEAITRSVVATAKIGTTDAEAETGEARSAYKKNTAELVRDALFADCYCFTDENDYEFCVVRKDNRDIYCTITNKGRWVSGDEAELVMRRHADVFNADFNEFLLESLAATG